MGQVEKIKQTKMIGLRVDQELFAAIRDGARDQGISNTSFVRMQLAQALGHFQEVPLEAPRRRARRKPVSAEQKKAIQVLALLSDIHQSLALLVQRSSGEGPQQTNVGDLNWEGPLRKLQKDISSIRFHLLGGC